MDSEQASSTGQGGLLYQLFKRFYAPFLMFREVRVVVVSSFCVGFLLEFRDVGMAQWLDASANLDQRVELR